MRPHGSAKWLEKRRRRAIQLLKRGRSPSQVARLVSAARGSVYRWKADFEMYGSTGLRSHTAHGRPAKLSVAEMQELEDVLRAGAVAFGFPNELWTLARIAIVIRRTFHQRYHPSGVWWVLHRLGWSCQKPERRAKQRDEDKIARWTRYHWPRIKKCQRLGITLVFVDESGFGLVPNVKRTWAPRGQTPYCPVMLKSGKINAIGAVVISAHQQRISLYVHFSKRSIRSPQVKRFLSDVLRHHQGQIMLLYDHSKTHTCKLVQAFLVSHPRVLREPFPEYAPELNPVEQVWSYADAGLANGAPNTVAQLSAKLRRIIAKLKSSQALLWACIYASHLRWPH